MDTRTRDSVLDWRSEIVQEALSWHYTPFHHKGRIKGVGVDCGGLIYEVYKTVLGIPLEPFPREYAEDWSLHKDDYEIYLDFLKPYVVLARNLLPGDVRVWKYGRNYSHGTIYIGNGKYIHAFGRTSRGCVAKSNESFFSIGAQGEIRESKSYTVSDKWV